MSTRSIVFGSVLGLALFGVFGVLGVMSVERGFWNPSDADIVARYRSPESKFTDIDGVRIHYLDEGRGPALVLVHGSSESLFCWDDVAARLVDRYRVIRLDIPDHGLSTADPQRRYGIADDTHRIEVLTARLGVMRFAIGGSSWGGTIAYSLAAAHPERVTALIVISAAGMRPPERSFRLPAPGNALQRWLSRYYQSRADIETSLRSVSADTTYLTPALLDQYAMLLNRRGRPAERAAKLPQIHEDETPAMAHAVVARIEAPTLILWGAANPAFGPGNADDFEAALVKAPRIRKVVYAGVGHKVEREAPARVATDIGTFLANVQE